jgi:hypothetical protein
MKNILYTILFLSIGINASAQEVINADLEPNDKPTIYVIGGIASVITKEDIEFAKKYNIQFYDFGCLAPVNISKYEQLNALVFEALDKIYGNKWQKEIRKGILGFEKWKKK